MMRFAIPRCPKCGDTPKGTLETVTGLALLQHEDNGLFTYSGETKMFWDEQKSVPVDSERVTLLCHQGHDWESAMEETE